MKPENETERERQVETQVRDAPFPMQNGPAIDWGLAEKIYKVYSRLYGKSQSLERLSQRGGFGWAEVQFMWKEHKRLYGAP